MTRRSVYSGTPWEPLVGYCRAKRVGSLIFVSGTTAVDERGEVVGAEDVYAQAHYALTKIERALAELGATRADVVRTRTFLIDIDRFDDFARAHREFFAEVAPAASCVEVARLVAPGLLIEIEVDAVTDSNSSS